VCAFQLRGGWFFNSKSIVVLLVFFRLLLREERKGREEEREDLTFVDGLCGLDSFLVYSSNSKENLE
jgi:hypothetical protein